MNQPGVVERLREALAALPPAAVRTPEADRLGAVLVLVEPRDNGDATLVYTRRRDDMRSHPGQISFPGGRVDAGETVEQAAVREAHEEVALDPGAVEIVGRMPAFFIPPSRFWLQPVVAHWTRPHELVAAEAEVAAVIHAPLSRLLDRSSWHVVGLSTAGWSWAWDLGDGHLLWGATAIVTGVLLGLLDPDWSGGALPQDYLHREVRPWERERRVLDRQQPARLPGVAERTFEAVGPDDTPVVAITPPRIEAAGHAVAQAARSLAGRADGTVVVLAGSGGTGAVGRAAAGALTDAGVAAEVVGASEAKRALAGPVAVVVDALVGTGLEGALRGDVLAMVNALRLRAHRVVAVDVPSGLHPLDGMVGDAVAADVTVAVGSVQPGLLLPGLAPFVGDLYLAALDGTEPPLVRVVGTRRAPTWRE